ncbi:SDR family NAD(P)-dependent oxidoreductase [Algiphilus sp.]|uniref:SDR family NAD(P)-dependent oxidoreductase n=1 Tax=Algiphilus sp. TaxID=1872431 RepID=UPI0025B7F6CE|nr:SDR family NAD(P)-dependent oxidoreductase [Abyssibacter sp.]MCK5859849.1 SDR family NAD(P)-dependent oxidoreductase [Abyssibacter sp.]
MAQVLITGGSSGIGLEMARSCLRRGHEVAITGRNMRKAQSAAERLADDTPGARVHALELDLSDFDRIDAAAGAIRECLPALTRVALNAGAFTRRLAVLDNGLEGMVGCMHFGHFRLMAHLFPVLDAAEDARIVITSSVAHWAGRIDETSFFDPSRHLTALQAYGQAKLANLLHARALARRAGPGLRVNAFHPGGVATDIWREMPTVARGIIDRVMITPARGADTGSWLLLDDDASAHSGDYLVNRRVAWSSPASRNVTLGEWLWERSQAIAGIEPDDAGSARMRA